MKIVYCIAAIANSGGMERVLANKANYLVRAGHEVHIITTDQQGRRAFFPIDHTIQQHDLGINYIDDVEQSLLSKIQAYRKKQVLHKTGLARLLKSIAPDIAISMFDHEVSFLWDINDGSKKILEIHFSRFKRLQYGRKGLWKLVDYWRSKQDKYWAKKYDKFVVLTEEDRGYWGKMSNIMVIPNANSFSPVRSAALVNKRVIAVGRYDFQKGFDELIRAWKLVAQEAKNWSLHIYGNGPLANELSGLITRLDLAGTVYLEKPIAAIEEAYLQSSLLVMTSRYEGLPMALLEGQACGLPLLAYACKCGPRDIIKNEANGYLIAEGDQRTLADRMLLLMKDQILRKTMGEESRRLATNFTEERVMKRWIDLFMKLL